MKTIKYLKILALSLSFIICNAQSGSFKLVDTNRTITNYLPIWRNDPVDKKDTVKCKLLVSIGSEVKVISGYEVIFKYRAMYITDIVYLDENKKRLSKLINVWMSK